MSTKRKALVVYGGWDGHQPKEVSELFRRVLAEEGFDVEMSDTLDVFKDGGKLNGLSLIVPHWTMGTLTPEQAKPVFEAVGLLGLLIAAMTGMVGEAEFRTERMRQAAELGYATATDLADWLVREAGIPFREAHHITGTAVKLADSKGVALDALSLAELEAIDSRVGEGVFAVLSVEASVAARKSHGGTAPEQVRGRIAEARRALGMDS